MTDPVEIARELTGDQKAALQLWPQREDWHHRRSLPKSKGFITIGLAEIGEHGLVRLTPLGLAVRTALVARLAAEEGDAPDGE